MPGHELHDPPAGELERALAAVSTPATLETPLGTFELFDGVPTAGSVPALYDALDFVRGVEVFLSTVPGASLVAMRRGFRSTGLTGSQLIGYTEPRANSGSLFLTPNTETTYGSMFFDLRETGPFVIEPPKQSLCVVDDFWFRYVAPRDLPLLRHGHHSGHGPRPGRRWLGVRVHRPRRRGPGVGRRRHLHADAAAEPAGQELLVRRCLRHTDPLAPPRPKTRTRA